MEPSLPWPTTITSSNIYTYTIRIQVNALDDQNTTEDEILKHDWYDILLSMLSYCNLFADEYGMSARNSLVFEDAKKMIAMCTNVRPFAEHDYAVSLAVIDGDI